MMTITKSTRTAWIDICKAIAILLMVLGHTGVNSVTNVLIHSFHMPVFFILSGYCFNEEKHKDFWPFCKRRFKALIIPYFVFGVFLFLFWDVALYLLNRKTEMRSIENLIKSICWDNAGASAFGVIQWFLPCLFFTELAFLCVLKITKCSEHLVGVFLLAFSILGYMFPCISDYRMPWALDCSLMATFFYGCGWVLRKIHFEALLTKLRRHVFVSVCTFVLMLGAGIYLTLINNEVNMRTLKYGNYFLFIINAFLMSGSLIMISYVLDCIGKSSGANRFLEWIGRNTLTVLLLNSTGVRVWEVLASKMIINKLSENMLYMLNILVALTITVVCCFVSELLKHYMPWLIGVPERRTDNE